MAKGAYIGVGGVAHKIKKGYIGVGGVARKIKKAYIGVGGVARLFFNSAPCFNITISGDGGNANTAMYAYVKGPDGSILETGNTYSFEEGTTLACFAFCPATKGTTKIRKYLTFGKYETLASGRGNTAPITYDYVVKTNATIELSYTLSNSTVTITEE